VILRGSLVHDRDEYLHELIGYYFAVFVLFHGVVKEDVPLVLVIVGIFYSKILLRFATCTLIYVKSETNQTISKLKVLNKIKRKRNAYLIIDLSNCNISVSVSCHMVAQL
jgi:hypothetical protein